MTGTYVDTSYATNLVGIMRYTLSNIQPGSSKLWCGAARRGRQPVARLPLRAGSTSRQWLCARLCLLHCRCRPAAPIYTAKVPSQSSCPPTPCRAPFVLSYAVLAWTGYCLIQHYKSYAMLRLLHLRHNSLHAAGECGLRRRGAWPLASALHGMLPSCCVAFLSSLLIRCSHIFSMRAQADLLLQVALHECTSSGLSAAAGPL